VTVEVDAQGESGAVGGVIGHGPFDHDIHETPMVLWVAVLVMCAGVTVAGVGITAFNWQSDPWGWGMVIGGAVLSVVGTIMLFANHVMDNVH
jgi:uncharacterized membrane protein HdeD (DUF308 family)